MAPPLQSILFHLLLLLCCTFQTLISDHDGEDHLLQGLNAFRNASNLPALAKHDKADCIADKIADQLENRPCSSAAQSSQLLSNYPNEVKKCKVDGNTTTDGVVLPVCVAHRVETLVLTNYTHGQNSRYLNDSRFSGAGIGMEEDWTVVVLATTTTRGSLAAAASLGYRIGWSPVGAGAVGLFAMCVGIMG